MAQKKKLKRYKKRSAGKISRLAFFLALAVVAGLSIVKYLETPQSGVVLLDIGIQNSFVDVQRNITARISLAMNKMGIPDNSIEIESERRNTKGHTVSVMKISVPSKSSLIQINAAIDKAVSSMGTKVKSCRQKQDGRSLEMEIGTRSTITHRLYIKKMRPEDKFSQKIPTGPKIAIVVDDFGYSDGRLVEEFLELDVEVTIAILPGLKHSESVSRMARIAGKESILHLPMEPEKGAADDGEIPLVRVSLLSREIMEVVEAAMLDTPGISGMNNHMGSRATADRRVMNAVMKVCKKKDLYFFDSLTTSKSVVREAAKAAGVKSARSELCLDNSNGKTRENMMKLLSIAKDRGEAAAIMHVKEDSLKDLKWFIGVAEKEGVRFIRLSDYVSVK